MTFCDIATIALADISFEMFFSLDLQPVEDQITLNKVIYRPTSSRYIYLLSHIGLFLSIEFQSYSFFKYLGIKRGFPDEVVPDLLQTNRNSLLKFLEWYE